MVVIKVVDDLEAVRLFVVETVDAVREDVGVNIVDGDGGGGSVEVILGFDEVQGFVGG